MRIAYIAAGAGGMYCGSCIHDNALATALIGRGHEVALVPTYTPLRTDEQSVSGGRIFYGAVNVYLEQKIPLWRRVPRPLMRLLDRPALLGWVGRLAGSTDAHELGALTLSVLEGEEGAQRAELDKLVAWLAGDYRPDLVHLTNSMFIGLARRLRAELAVPVVASVQGEDLFLDQLDEPWRERVLAEMRRRARDVDRFVSPSRYYAGAMSALLDQPSDRFAVVPLGIRLEGHGEEGGERPADAAPAIGYLARIAPEKGLHLLAEAFRLLAGRPGHERLRLRVAGYLGPRDRDYLAGIRRDLDAAGLAERCDFVGEVDLAGKIAFLHSVDLLSVPTVYREPKGLFALEAMANGTPVVVPRHGSFPEMLEATGGGLLVEPNDPAALAEGIAELVADPERRRALGAAGREAVHGRFSVADNAAAIEAVYAGLL